MLVHTQLHTVGASKVRFSVFWPSSNHHFSAGTANSSTLSIASIQCTHFYYFGPNFNFYSAGPKFGLNLRFKLLRHFTPRHLSCLSDSCQTARAATFVAFTGSHVVSDIKMRDCTILRGFHHEVGHRHRRRRHKTRLQGLMVQISPGNTDDVIIKFIKVGRRTLKI